jgi:hypothetical protein
MTSKINELKKIERLEALKNNKLNKQGDAKKIVIIEVINIYVKTPKSMIKHPYYNVLSVYSYDFIDTYDEITRIKSLLTRWCKITPLEIIPLVRNEKEDDLLLTYQYYNERNKKYFDYIVKNGIYKNKIDALRYLQNDVDVNNIQNFIDAKKFTINYNE